MLFLFTTQPWLHLRHARWRLYANANCTRMLLKSLTIVQLHRAMAQRGIRQLDSDNLRLYMHVVPDAATVL
jgi:hypothetical protein